MKNLIMISSLLLGTFAGATTITSFSKVANLSSGEGSLAYVNQGTFWDGQDMRVSMILGGVCCVKCAHSQTQQNIGGMAASVGDDSIILKLNESTEKNGTLYICH